ncbi:class I SAM-dependent methyltransferase [Marinobacter salarius]|uniref:class I SAM-dependent methyltransferase n=1 Tax=Marinobacter salarius TaxID=1420917 RepID=UPI003D9C5C24
MMDIEIVKRESLRLRRMASLVSHGRSIADVGFYQCPNPFLAAEKVVGIDPNADKRNLAYHYSDMFSGTLADYIDAIGPESFDVVLAGELIEHLEVPVDFLRDCYRSLKPGGRIVLSTPNPNSLIERLLTLSLSRQYFYTTEHVMLIPQRWLIRMMEIAGFENIRLYSGGFPFPLLGLVPFPRPWCYQTIATGEKPLASSS